MTTGPEEIDAYRASVRRWLRENLPDWWLDDRDRAEREARKVDVRAEWQRTLHAAGYAGIDWSPDFGGQGRSRTHLAVFLEESALLTAPPPVNLIGLYMVGPTIARWGTAEQRARHLPAMLDGSAVWSLGLSETEAGSDLSAVRMRAVPDAHGRWVVSGEKVWTSYAHVAHWAMVLARSENGDCQARPFTCLLVDMASPGVAVQELRDMTGEVVFNQVRLDDVVVPADGVLGTPHRGWRVAMTALGYERANLGLVFQADTQRQIQALRGLVEALRAAGSPLPDGVRRTLALLQTEATALRLTCYRYLLALPADEVPGPEGSVLKLYWSELNQRITELAWDLLGPAALSEEALAAIPGAGRWRYEMLRARANTIEAGTSEILRTTIAERVLGLPRSR
jgi:alkylation response protein AidB-like acyl-CoA dehydrogenase